MKLFSILNKPAAKAGNKQAGIVFLEYVIMAFIVTVAVICALWWFYWHLQQMTWEVKQKLDTLKTLTCPLEPPYGAAPGDQPSTQIGPYEFAADGGEVHRIDNITFSDQNVEICNLNPVEGSNIIGIVHFWDNNGSGYIDSVIFGPLEPQNCINLPFSHTGPGSYSISFGASGGGNYSITVSELP